MPVFANNFLFIFQQTRIFRDLVILFLRPALSRPHTEKNSLQRMGVFRGGAAGTAAPPPNRKFFALFKYSLSSFWPNHKYSLCRIA